MPPQQFAQVIQTIPQLHIRKWKDEDVAMLFKICYWCALRFGEALRLKVEDFDLISHEVFLGKTKANKNDYAMIPPTFLPELQMYLLGKSGLLFETMTYQVVYHWLKMLGEKLEIDAWTTPQSETGEKTKTHIFRKSLAKDLLYGIHNGGKKMEINIISKTLRHKGKNPIATTFHYIKADNETVKDWWESDTPRTEEIG